MLLIALACALGFSSCSTSNGLNGSVLGKSTYRSPRADLNIPKSGHTRVRTTAYTHTEADHKVYGLKTALGTKLRCGSINSAASDWSRFPVGTTFKIEGDPKLYVIDDYGSALVGTNTIDLYKPCHGTMNAWGAKHVNIKVLKWGSYSKSLKIMRERTHARHVRRMVESLRSRVRQA